MLFTFPASLLSLLLCFSATNYASVPFYLQYSTFSFLQSCVLLLDFLLLWFFTSCLYQPYLFFIFFWVVPFSSLALNETKKMNILVWLKLWHWKPTFCLFRACQVEPPQFRSHSNRKPACRWKITLRHVFCLALFSCSHQIWWFQRLR